MNLNLYILSTLKNLSKIIINSNYLILVLFKLFLIIYYYIFHSNKDYNKNIYNFFLYILFLLYIRNKIYI